MKEYIQTYNQQVKEQVPEENQSEYFIDDKFFDDVVSGRVKDSKLIEKMARYGNPTIFQMPSVLQTDISCDLSFSGIMDYAINLLYEPKDPF